MKHMSSYMKNSYEFIVYINSYMNSYIWISRHMNSHNHYMNSHMKRLYEFIYEMNTWIHEYMNSRIWIQMCRFWFHKWIHKYINFDIRIHCIQSELLGILFYILSRLGSICRFYILSRLERPHAPANRDPDIVFAKFLARIVSNLQRWPF